MSADNPPTYNFNGINFNPSFYTETVTNDFSQVIADTRYLIKTQNDTATGLETFTGGIKSNIYNSVLQSDNVSLFTGNTGNINFATSSLRTPATPIDIGGINCLIRFGGTSSAQITTADNSAYFVTSKAAAFEPGVATGILQIASSQESAIAVLNIGNAALRTGDINIATQVTGTQNINIASLNSTLQKININRPLTVKYVNSTYATDLSQIGSEKTTFITSNAMSSGTIVNLCSFTAVPIGRYMIYFNIENTITTNTVSFNPYEVGVTISTASFSVILGGMYIRENEPTSTKALGLHSDFRCGYINLTVSNNIYLVAKYTWTGTGVITTTANFKIVRIG
jgi:hypothetical protein